MTAEPSLFDQPADVSDLRHAGTPASTSVDTGAARRDAGAQLAELSAHTSWRLAAEAAIARLAATGRVFTIEDIRDAVGAPPGHLNALGGVVIIAAKRRQIVAVGYRPSSRPAAHARPVRTWRGLL